MKTESDRKRSPYYAPHIVTFGTLVQWDSRYQNERLHCKPWGGNEPPWSEPENNNLSALNSPPVSADALRLEVGLEMLDDTDQEVTL